MKLSVLLVLASFVLFAFFPCRLVQGQTMVEYVVEIGSDGSSAWTVQQTVTNVSASIGTLIELRSKVDSLISDASNLVGRSMQAEEDAFSLMSNYSGSYVVVEYKFNWMNFSQVGDSNITVGDVFGVPDFFSRLYGDGQIVINYPLSYVVGSVSPPPEARDDSAQTLQWPGTLDFNTETRIVLVRSTTSVGIDSFERNVVLVGVSVVAIGGASVGVYSLMRRRKKQSGLPLRAMSEGLLGLESDEKIVELVRLKGGKVRQSEITDNLNFSKAKTSQLLSGLEKKGTVKRYKQGRDKIVVLVENVEDGKQ